MNQITHAAANWWAEQLKPGEDNHDVGDAMGNLLSNMMSTTAKAPSDEAVEVFRQSLERQLTERYDNFLDRFGVELFGSIAVSVDYGPGMFLCQALEEANIRDIGSMLLPFKTHMRITANKVEVSKGYRAPYVTVIEIEKDEVK